MPVGRSNISTPRYGVQITTVDPSQGLVKGVFGGDAQERQISVYTTPPAFRWPIVGEQWMVEQKNGSWYLDGVWPSTTTYQGIGSGDLVLNAPTGIVHVLGSAVGNTDFTLRTPGRVTLVGGTATVSTAVVTATSNIFLTAQDNNTTGALRVSSRTPGVAFTITSSNNGDHGVVAYQIS